MSRFNRFIRNFLLNILSNKIDELINNHNRVSIIERKINKMLYDIYELYPSCIIQNETVKQQIKKFRELYNISSKLNTKVSKNDIMYQYRGCQDYNDDGSESFIFEGYTTFARMLKQVEPVSKIEVLKGEIT